MEEGSKDWETKKRECGERKTGEVPKDQQWLASGWEMRGEGIREDAQEVGDL